MRQYDYREKWKKLLTPEIVSYIAQIRICGMISDEICDVKRCLYHKYGSVT